MDGKVEVSILQWEQQREELKVLREQNATLKQGQKEVKLHIIDKEPYGHFQYDRWTNQNKWVTENKNVTQVIKVGLDEVKDVIRGEVKEELITQMNETDKKSEKSNRDLQEFKNNQDGMIEKLRRDVKKKYETEIETLKTEIKDIKKEAKTDLDNFISEKKSLEKEKKSLLEEKNKVKKWYQF